MANYVAPAVYPYVDDTTALVSADYNPLIAALVDLGSSGGRVDTLETSGVRAVIVSTGSEARPAANVVLWVCSSGADPVNAIATDLVFLPQDGSGSGSVSSTITAAATAAARVAAVVASTITVGSTVVASAGIGAASTVTAGASVAANKADTAAASPSITAAASADASAGATALFSDDFNRANGAVGNGWTGPVGATLNIVSNALTFANWEDYNLVNQSTLPKNVSVRATFSGTISSFHGIFLGFRTGVGVKLFNNGGTWVIGDASAFDATNTNVAFSNTPSTPYTSLRLDLTSGTTITAYINGTLVHTATLTALGITLSATAGNVYQTGYCGTASSPGLDSFEVWAS